MLWQDPAVRLSLLVSMFAVTGVLAVSAAALSATQVSLRCTAAALVVLAVLAVRWSRSRWAPAAGCLLFAVAALVRDAAVDDTGQDAGWFGYGPSQTVALQAMLDAAGRAYRSESIATLVQLGAVVLLVAAVLGLPRAHRRVRVVATTVAAVVVGVGVLAGLWFDVDLDEMAGVARCAWPGPLAVAAALGLLLLAGRREDRRWLVAAGAGLVAVQAAVTQSDLTGAWLTVAALTDALCGDAYTAIAWGTAVDEGVEYGPALTAALTIAGPALIVLGTPRAGTRTAGGDDTPPPPATGGDDAAPPPATGGDEGQPPAPDGKD
ncbi:hypothetical protein GCM10009827_102220 [Dactylosporangium maewongense]|uniref:Integral membrane protein n=1 Tax=Dactylosporangium maewongense TaxID=634393 RepID=A0ABP4NP92_9ACTN